MSDTSKPRLVSRIARHIQLGQVHDFYSGLWTFGDRLFKLVTWFAFLLAADAAAAQLSPGLARNTFDTINAILLFVWFALVLVSLQHGFELVAIDFTNDALKWPKDEDWRKVLSVLVVMLVVFALWEALGFTFSFLSDGLKELIRSLQDARAAKTVRTG